MATLEMHYENHKKENPESTLSFEEWQKKWVKDLKLDQFQPKEEHIKILEEKTVCPHCGETENFHYNYDYSKADLPYEDILCNNCGEIFK